MILLEQSVDLIGFADLVFATWVNHVIDSWKQAQDFDITTRRAVDALLSYTLLAAPDKRKRYNPSPASSVLRMYGPQL